MYLDHGLDHLSRSRDVNDHVIVLSAVSRCVVSYGCSLDTKPLS